MKRKLCASLIAAICLTGIGIAVAATPQDADSLGNSLTPVGAEKSGNKEGTIPVWSGTPPASNGWTFGKQRSEYSEYKSEKPLFTIDASNVDKYAGKLSPAQVAMFKQDKSYRMDVYPSHRNCGVPKWVEERTKLNAVEARMAPNGIDIEHARAGGIPFPVPKTGAEVMWNHKLRYVGVGAELINGGSLISPRPGSDEFVPYSWELSLLFPNGSKDAKNVEDNGVEFDIYFKYSQPAALAGQALMAVSYLNKDPESYYYFPGQRRVRRLPTYTFDTPQIGFENQYTVDQNWFFWARLERFKYTLVGKQEMYIPHDVFKMYDFNAKREDVYQKTSVNPAYRRYELHRVWVVEATALEGVRHSFPKRRFYIDEDTWHQVVAEDYDAKGQPWKLREAWQIPAWDLGGACTFGNFAQYDLVEKRYMTDWSVIGQGKDVHFFTQEPDNRFKQSFYQPETLRALSER